MPEKIYLCNMSVITLQIPDKIELDPKETIKFLLMRCSYITVHPAFIYWK
jgi:hypothetical protein